MKEYKYLYQKMLNEETIRSAYKKLRKGKTKRWEIQYIDKHLDEEVEKMRNMILNTKPPGVEVPNPELAYHPEDRVPRTIHEHGKTRKIYMPNIWEQWLHHIIVLVLEPIVTATAYPYSCGSFPNRGAHYAKRQMVQWIKLGKNIRYFAKVDIRHFYDNVRHDILLRELRIRIKDEWFLYIIMLCLQGFKKGIPLGFYISQWLANYLLEPLDRFMTKELGFDKYMRYMDDMSWAGNNKKELHRSIIAVAMFIGRRFRLKLKHNYQVFKFYYEKGAKVIGRELDFMGFLFYRDRVLIRERIMLAATRLARKMHRAKEQGRRYYEKHIKAMLSYVGWFSCTDSYNCYLEHIKPFINVGKLKKIVSKLDRRTNHDEVGRRKMLGVSGGTAAYC